MLAHFTPYGTLLLYRGSRERQGRGQLIRPSKDVTPLVDQVLCDAIANSRRHSCNNDDLINVGNVSGHGGNASIEAVAGCKLQHIVRSSAYTICYLAIDVDHLFVNSPGPLGFDRRWPTVASDQPKSRTSIYANM